MRNRIKHIVERQIALLLVAVMAMLVFNQSFNIHSHRLSDGTIITHAHPFQKSAADDGEPVSSHEHSHNDYVFLDHFSLLFIVLAIFLAATIFSFSKKNYFQLIEHIKTHNVNHAFGRAPPIY